MDTPEIFYESLSKGIITYEMLDLALFSLNKRAKNYRDQKRKAKKSLYAQRSCLVLVIRIIRKKPKEWRKNFMQKRNGCYRS